MGSRFYGSLDGKASTQATRQGTPKSGLVGHIRGWECGIEVQAFVDDAGRDSFRVYLTGGSNGRNRQTRLLAVHMGDNNRVVLVAPELGAALNASESLVVLVNPNGHFTEEE